MRTPGLEDLFQTRVEKPGQLDEYSPSFAQISEDTLVIPIHW